MRFDYTSVLERIKQQIPRWYPAQIPWSRQQLRALLGIVGISCLCLAFFPRSPEIAISAHTTNKQTVSLEISGSELAAAVVQLQSADHSNHNKDNRANSVATNTRENSSAVDLSTGKNTASKNESSEIAKNNNDKTDFTFRTVTLQNKDTLAKVFNRYGISKKDLNAILSNDKAKSHLTSLKPGQTLKLQINKENKIDELTLELGPATTLVITRKSDLKGDNFEVEHKELPIEKRIAFGKGEIQASLVSAVKKAGLDQNIVSQMVEIFGGNIDFSQDLQPNDKFRVLFEQNCLDDSPIQTGPILAAEIVYGGNNVKKLQAVRYTDKSGLTGYFSPEGFGLNQAFLRSPVNFASISSGFGMRRHPVLHRLRQHKGVDFAAPRGTPVQATADAKVLFVGNKGGYGKVVELQHGARYSTLYAHLSKFAKNIKAGSPIKQGQVIGYVGRTGLATGDHLHYEFRIDGVHRNPMTVTLPKSKSIPDSNKRHFLAHAKEMIRLMDLHEQQINVAVVEFKVDE